VDALVTFLTYAQRAGWVLLELTLVCWSVALVGLIWDALGSPDRGDLIPYTKKKTHTILARQEGAPKAELKKAA
jgi:hypothetical protein